LPEHRADILNLIPNFTEHLGPAIARRLKLERLGAERPFVRFAQAQPGWAAAKSGNNVKAITPDVASLMRATR